MKRLALIALLAGSAHVAPASSSLNAAPQQQDLRSVRKQIDSVRKDIAEKEAVKKEAQSAIAASEEAIAAMARALATLNQQQDHSAQRLAELSAALEANQAQVKSVQTRVARMLAERYKRGQHDAMQLMLNANDPNQAGRDLTYYRRIAAAQQTLIADLATRQADLSRMADELNRQLAELDTLSNAKEREKRLLELNKASRQETVSTLAGQIQNQQGRLAKLKEDERQLARLIARINREIEARRLAAEKRAAGAKKARELARRQSDEERRQEVAAAKKQGKAPPPDTRRPEVEEPIDAVADGSASGRAFRSLQGRMKLPVAGTLAGRFGGPRSEGTTWKGVYIKAPVGQAVRAVADGRVVYADALRGYGNAVIVDHGGNYLTIYTGLAAIVRGVGQEIRAGDALGSSGTLDSGETGLYFEIRYLGRPVNPMAWAR
ncbi:murein hydrolase activator EnvC family protein [Crenobacter cavernae]|uniref:Peptidase M23 n=1 Tax=Crenobacter cavernae TaxID=2290923 RepID=A0ABY0FGZ2_9NEIS|nr:peptidoglycan DD-metalloendopeptidase family protein [Crenobacter cavernae]RXZ45657.1 peptidase M23 [Crenobacter cavernae]